MAAHTTFSRSPQVGLSPTVGRRTGGDVSPEEWPSPVEAMPGGEGPVAGAGFGGVLACRWQSSTPAVGVLWAAEAVFGRRR
jgi:hypothetical protein